MASIEMGMTNVFSYANSDKHCLGDPDEISPKTCIDVHLLPGHHHRHLFNPTHFNREQYNAASGPFLAVHVERHRSDRR